ncbi:MAG: NADH-dependent [FeFe] hydrogenase, group A6 [Anaerovoracaceae bacterium]|nr:NADH-dependent [FeFe] hydrogenase, group A6 [Bacillota bacterium]MDY2670550.1 NADH-dependent [FeFe] hydrogenase, group A6 [Anaerovoracaceae bacterium]
MSMVNITIDGKAVQVEEGTTVLEAAKSAGIDIPTLCYLKGVNEIGACRMCLVEIKGARALQAACVYPVAEGNEIYTASPAVRNARKANLELLLSNHKKECLTCERNRNCELQALSEQMNVKEIPYEGEMCQEPIDDSSPSIVRDPQKCVLCRRCVGACTNLQAIHVIDAVNRGFNTLIAPAFGKPLGEAACVNCGQCVISCPVGALTEKSSIKDVWKAVEDPDKVVLVQTAPAVRAAIGEEFGMPIGTAATRQMVGALLRMGFDKVFDTDTSADLTILEEGTELLNRMQNGGTLPMITSCSPGWIKFAEHYYPDLLPNLSSCKSPHEMFGAVLKTYYAQEAGIDPKKIVTVSVMPCTAKKFECQRPELSNNGMQDVDYVLTTRELAKMIKECGINFAECDGDFERPFGDASGAGVIFGATGGVMEAALRTVADILTGEDLKDIEYTDVRGVQGVKEAAVEVNGQTIKVAVAHGLGNARKVLDKIRSGEADWQFIEIMACPGGCVNGGGQPIQPAKVKNWIDIRAERAKAIYSEDRNSKIRKSHKNESVMKGIYEGYLGEPGSEKAHELLHTTYTPRERF